MEKIRAGEWKDSSGNIHNPAKSFFLKLSASAVRDGNHRRDADGLSYARKLMIITVMALNTNGFWEEGNSPRNCSV